MTQTHNFRSHVLYYTWQNMLRRCYNVHHQDYHLYGGRGITVCDEWRYNPWKFAEYMGIKPNGYTLDRKDTNGNYEPGNCRWVDNSTQAYNQRTYKSNTSGQKGVTWDKNEQVWRARISKNGKRYFLGRFKEFEEAVKARKEAEAKLYD